MGAAAGLIWTDARLASWLIFDLCEAGKEEHSRSQRALSEGKKSTGAYVVRLMKRKGSLSSQREHALLRSPSRKGNRQPI